VWVGYGSSPETTNNRMELMAVKQGLLFIRASDLPCIVTALEMGHCASAERMNQPKKINVITDSAYVVEGATLWLQRWRQKDWMAVAHHDLWQSIGEAMDRDQITFHHVRGHQGHAENEVCDRLAAKARKEQTSEEFIRPNWVEFRKQVLESD
jgi:ribonuclease HI